MSVRSTDPEHIKPYSFHGVELRQTAGSADWTGTCPFCDKDRHFFVSPDTGMYDCKVCGERGNVVTFMTNYARMLADSTPASKYASLARRRGIPSKALKEAGLAWDDSMMRWVIPCRSARNTVRDLRVWTGKQVMCTAGCKTQLHGIADLASALPGTRVWLCEGDWDWLTMRAVVRDSKMRDVAVGVPGAGVLKPDWIEALTGMDVVCAYDADDAGQAGAMRALEKMTGRVRSLGFVNWPESVPAGFDLRDYVNLARENGKDAQDIISDLLDIVDVTPRGAERKEGDGVYNATPVVQRLADVSTFDEVRAAFDDKIRMTQDMVNAVRVMLAVCLSNGMGGDPLWLYVVGQPGAGKTLLLSSLAGSQRCVFRSSVTPHGLVSGWKEGKDPSLIPQLSGKTFVLKDFTEILSMPEMQQEEVYSTLRGAYDGSVEKSFGNGVNRVYNPTSTPPFTGFSMLAGVTGAIHGYKRAHLGERFLKYQLEAMSDDDRLAIIHAAMMDVGGERNRELELQSVAGGFLESKWPDTAEPPLPTQGMLNRVGAAAMLVAHLRSQVIRERYSDEISTRPEPEMATRLAKQLIKLSRLVALVDGDAEAGERQWPVIRKVALDTAYGYHLDLVRETMRMGGAATVSELETAARIPRNTLNRRIDDMLALGLFSLSKSDKISASGGRPARVYEVGAAVRKLWETFTNQEQTSWTGKKESSGGVAVPRAAQRGSSTLRKRRRKVSRR